MRKGKDNGAQPVELLLKAYDNFVAGKKVLIEDCKELTAFTSYRGKQKSSESSMDSPMSTGTGLICVHGITNIKGSNCMFHWTGTVNMACLENTNSK